MSVCLSVCVPVVLALFVSPGAVLVGFLQTAVEAEKDAAASSACVIQLGGALVLGLLALCPPGPRS